MTNDYEYFNQSINNDDVLQFIKNYTGVLKHYFRNIEWTGENKLN